MSVTTPLVAVPERRIPWKRLGAVAGAAILAWMFWRVDRAALVTALRRSDLRLVAAVGLLNFVAIGLKAWRWQIVIAAAQPVRLALVALTTLIGFMANAVLPARAGELVRVVLLGQRGGVSKTTLLASLALDRLLEGVAMIAVLVALPLLTPTPLWFRSATWALSAVVFGLLALGVVIGHGREHRWLRRLPVSQRIRAWLAHVLERLSAGFAALRSPGHLVSALVISVLGWGLQGLMLWLCLTALDVHLSLLAAFLVLMAVNVGVMAPAAPGSVGTFELATVVALAFLGVAEAPALAFALIYHAVQLIPTVLAGLLVLPLVGVRWRDLRGRAAET